MKANPVKFSLCYSNCDCPPEYECYKINKNTGACLQLNKEYAEIEEQKESQKEISSEEKKNT